MSLTCISCKLLFSAPQLHQEHYKTDWHRYNLKRRLVELPPLTKEDYDKRADAFISDIAPKDLKGPSRCDACNKNFSSQNALANHIKSKRHVESISKGTTVFKKTKNLQVSEAVEELIDDGNDDEWSDEDDWESCDGEGSTKKIVIDTNDCLFCEHIGNSAEDNVSHMTNVHSFFIPDVEYLSDLDGLIACLAAKIYLYHICLWCNGKGKGFRSAKSVKRHMIDKGHCKMLHEGDALLYYVDFYEYPTIENSEENIDATNIENLLENADYELVLPSGSTIGHRSLSLYYKQNLKLDTPGNQHKVKRVIQQYKSLGYTGCTGQVAVRKAKDIMYMRRIRDRYDLKLGIKKNKLQPHFRQQVMF